MAARGAGWECRHGRTSTFVFLRLHLGIQGKPAEPLRGHCRATPQGTLSSHRDAVGATPKGTLPVPPHRGHYHPTGDTAGATPQGCHRCHPTGTLSSHRAAAGVPAPPRLLSWHRMFFCWKVACFGSGRDMKAPAGRAVRGHRFPSALAFLSPPLPPQEGRGALVAHGWWPCSCWGHGNGAGMARGGAGWPWDSLGWTWDSLDLGHWRLWV